MTITLDRHPATLSTAAPRLRRIGTARPQPADDSVTITVTVSLPAGTGDVEAALVADELRTRAQRLVGSRDGRTTVSVNSPQSFATAGRSTARALPPRDRGIAAVSPLRPRRTGIVSPNSPARRDAEAARAVGVPVKAVKIGLFVFVGFCAWVLGMHLLFAYQVMQSAEGVGNEFIYIIAAVVGGCLLTGGYGSVVGAALGALIFGMTQMGINYAGWNVDWFYTFLGVMLLLATLVNTFVQKKAGGR